MQKTKGGSCRSRNKPSLIVAVHLCASRVHAHGMVEQQEHVMELSMISCNPVVGEGEGTDGLQVQGYWVLDSDFQVSSGRIVKLTYPPPLKK